MRDLSDTEIARLQSLLDALAALAPSGAPLDVSALDGYLCGVLLQPQPVAEADWWPFGPTPGAQPPKGPRAPAPAVQADLAPLVRRRHEVLAEAIAGRRWFDPWIFELEDADDEGGAQEAHEAHEAHDTEATAPSPVRESLLPWVAGFAIAAERFPALMRHDEQALAEPLALLYQHFDAEDLDGLEDEPALADALAAVEPPGDMAEAAEDLVRAVLLLADVSRPNQRPNLQPNARPAPRTAPSHASPGPGPRSKNGRPGRARRG